MSAVPEPFAEPPLYFVCYSRAQVDLVTKIEAKLAARRRRGELDLWRDKRNLDDGEEFTPAILQALQRAAGAIVVVSDEWNASDFIQDHEWPTITQRKEEKSWFKIFLLAFHALDDNSPLDKKNFVNDIKEQLLVRRQRCVAGHRADQAVRPDRPARQGSSPASDQLTAGNRAAGHCSGGPGPALGPRGHGQCRRH